MSRPYAAAVGMVCVLSGLPVFSQQHRVDSSAMYERLRCVVPLIGKGTMADPKRPQYAPTPTAFNGASRSGIIGFTHQVSDDGKFALVEFVARDRSAFKDILSDTTVRSFLKGRDSRQLQEAEFKKYKKDFDLSRFGVRVP